MQASTLEDLPPVDILAPELFRLAFVPGQVPGQVVDQVVDQVLHRTASVPLLMSLYC